MELPKKIIDEIWDYCRLNGVTDINGFTIKMVKQGFTVEKYGATPTDRIVEKEVEKIVEVEKIIEVIKEVPVEKIIEKLIEVEKEVIREVKVTDNEETNKLLAEIESIKNNERIHKQALKSIASEKDDLVAEIEELKVKLEDEKELFKDLTSLKRQNKDLTDKLSNVISELEAEKAKPKQEIKKDIYGEGKIGFFGSNTSDI